MLQSKLFTKTRKEVPADEVAKNAQLLIRAGYINKEMAGVYSLLPLGLRVINKITNIIREEMNAAGAIEVGTTSGVDNTFELNNGITAITPNPTNSQSVITFKNEVGQNVKLSLTNSAGAKIADLVNEFYTSGYHSLNLNLNDLGLSNGAYFLNITIGSWSQTKQIVITR